MDALIGSLEPGKKADVVLVKNDHSPVMFPVLHPYGHVAFQAQRGDVHTVIVNGRVVKHEGRLVGVDLAAARRAIEETVEFAQRELGDAWTAGMHPEIPETQDPRRTPTSTRRSGEHDDRARSVGGRASRRSTRCSSATR